MMTNLGRLLRLAAAVLLVGLWAAPAEARPWSPFRRQEAAERTASTDRPHGDPVAGAVWIAAGVALFVFMAWVAVRMSSHDRHGNKLPG